jgi:hypothetical protein
MKSLSVLQSAMKPADKSATQPTDKPSTRTTLEEVRTRFEIWRQGKKPGSRIPKCLWAAAVDVCIDQPIYHVSRALGLNYTELKRRVARTKGAADTQNSSEKGFVELSLGLEAQRVLCSIELESPRGNKVKMSFAGKCRDLDPLELAKLFWGAGG